MYNNTIDDAVEHPIKALSRICGKLAPDDYLERMDDIAIVSEIVRNTRATPPQPKDVQGALDALDRLCALAEFHIEDYRDHNAIDKNENLIRTALMQCQGWQPVNLELDIPKKWKTCDAYHATHLVLEKYRCGNIGPMEIGLMWIHYRYDINRAIEIVKKIEDGKYILLEKPTPPETTEEA